MLLFTYVLQLVLYGLIISALVYYFGNMSRPTLNSIVYAALSVWVVLGVLNMIVGKKLSDAFFASLGPDGLEGFFNVFFSNGTSKKGKGKGKK